MYPQHLIDEVRNAADIVDVVSDYVKLKKAGGYFVGLSPFKSERTPSFTVTPSKQIYKCFSTGKGGNVFTFLMELDGVSFTEAVKILAKRYNVALPEEAAPDDSVQSRHREGVLHALRFATAHFQQNFFESDAAAAARAYVEKRGMNTAVVKKFGIGFAFPSYNNLLNAAKSAGINDDYLFDAGLIRRREESTDAYDYFRDRLMFPIFDASNRVIGFGGRVLENADGPKYLNSPETIVYHKSKVLYGIQLARNEFRKKEMALLVEGYMDVIALQANDILNVVATSGTALTQDQARTITRYTNNLMLIYDADDAGQKAMIRALPICLKEGLSLKMLHLPEGEDPDSFVRNFGAEAFNQFAAEHAKDFVSFLIETAQLRKKWDDPNDRKAVVDLIIQNLAFVSDPVMRDILTNDLAQKAKIGTRSIESQISETARSNRQQEQRQQQRQHSETDAQEGRPAPAKQVFLKPVKRPPYELEVLRLMLENGLKMVEYVGQNCNADYFADPELRLLFHEIITRYELKQALLPDDLIALPPPYPSIAADILMERVLPGDRSLKIMKDSGQEPPSVWKSAKGALKLLRRHYLDRKIDEVEKALSDHEKNPPGSEGYQRLRELELKIKKMLIQINSTSVDELFADPEGVETDFTKKMAHDSES